MTPAEEAWWGKTVPNSTGDARRLFPDQCDRLVARLAEGRERLARVAELRSAWVGRPSQARKLIR